VLGRGSARGTRLSPEAFNDYVFGVVLLNDWSARDIQPFESYPLGPMLAKSFATQVGPWVVPMAALDPYRCPNPHALNALPHLKHSSDFLLDIDLVLTLASQTMQRDEIPAQPLVRSNYREIYWDAGQQLAHLTSNGAPIRCGDLIGSGTISGAPIEQAGCLLERTSGGREPLRLPDRSARTYLEDGDVVSIRGFASRAGQEGISLGALTGKVVSPGFHEAHHDQGRSASAR